MPVIERLEQNNPDDPEYMFECPGCGENHWFKTTGSKPRWEFNGDLDSPTVTPSLLSKVNNSVCHFFVRDGKIQFLDDCTHDKAWSTVSMLKV